MADIDGLEEFLNYLNRVASNVDNIIDESLEKTATMVIADTKLNTPVKTTNLKSKRSQTLQRRRTGKHNAQVKEWQ